METKQRSFLTDILSVFGNNIFILIITFFTSIILARYLGPDGRGIYAAILIYPILLTSLAELGIRQATVYLVGKNEYPPEKIIGALLWCLIISSIISVIIVGGIFFYLKDPDFTPFIVILTLIYIPLRLTISYSNGIFLGKGEIRRFNQMNWIPPVILFFGLIFLVVLAHLYVVGALIATLSGILVMAIYALYLLSNVAPLKISFDKDIILKLLSLGIVYGLALFVLNLNYKVDIVLMQVLSTSAEIGQYSVGVGIADLLWQIPAAVGVVIFSRSANAKESELFSKSLTLLFRVTLVLTLICGIALFFLAPYLIPVIYGVAFSPSTMVVQLILPGIILMTAFKVLNMDLAGKGKPIFSLIAFTPAVIINILLNIFWIPMYGANGAAMASTVSYSIGALFFLLLYSRETNISLKELFRFNKSDFNFIKRYIIGSFR